MWKKGYIFFSGVYETYIHDDDILFFFSFLFSTFGKKMIDDIRWNGNVPDGL